MLQRVLEPELMDDPHEAMLYDEMDHSGVNKKFVEDMRGFATVEGLILDVGTGTAQIPIEICQQAEDCKVMACDLAISMLEIAKLNIAVAGFEHRIQLYHGDAKSLDCDDQTFDWVVSNSLVHHIPAPGPAIEQMIRVLRPGGRLFIRDLLRPETEAAIENLVVLHTANEPPLSQQLFRQSLAAALSLEEVRELAVQFGFATDCVQATSDRHWTWCGIRNT